MEQQESRTRSGKTDSGNQRDGSALPGRLQAAGAEGRGYVLLGIELLQ